MGLCISTVLNEGQPGILLGPSAFCRTIEFVFTLCIVSTELAFFVQIDVKDIKVRSDSDRAKYLQSTRIFFSILDEGQDD